MSEQEHIIGILDLITDMEEKDTSNGDYKLYKAKIKVIDDSGKEHFEWISEFSEDSFKNIVKDIKVGDLVDVLLEHKGSFTNVKGITNMNDQTKLVVEEESIADIENGKKGETSNEEQPKPEVTKDSNKGTSERKIKESDTKGEISENYFTKLSSIKCPSKKIGKLDYVPWNISWSEIKKRYANASFHVHEDPVTNLPYFTSKAGGFIKITVTVNNIEHTVWQSILNNYHKSVPTDNINVFDVNSTIQRGLAKGIALHGLGIEYYIDEALRDLKQE